MITGSESREGDEVCIEAEAPLACVMEYSSALKFMTSGEGEFSMTFSRYEQVPGNIQKALVAEARQ